MRPKLSSSAFFLALVFSLLQIQNVYALSCAETFPVVGMVSNITNRGSYTEIVMDRVYTFDRSSWNINNTYSIDRYENIVAEYVKNNYQLSEKPSSEYNEWVNTTSVPSNAFNQTQIEKGDIIINGPPFHVCNYRFTGVFTKDGKMKNAIVNDNYQDYSYHNNRLEVEAGKELECDGSDRCKMEVNFKLDGKLFRLSPGQSHMPIGNSIKSIALVDSGDLKKRSDGTTIFDWGSGTYVTYALDFSGSTIQPTPTPSLVPIPTPTPRPAPIPEQLQSPEPAPPPMEDLNILQKIWRWFLSFSQ